VDDCLELSEAVELAETLEEDFDERADAVEDEREDAAELAEGVLLPATADAVAPSWRRLKALQEKHLHFAKL